MERSANDERRISDLDAIGAMMFKVALANVDDILIRRSCISYFIMLQGMRDTMFPTLLGAKDESLMLQTYSTAVSQLVRSSIPYSVCYLLPFWRSCRSFCLLTVVYHRYVQHINLERSIPKAMLQLYERVGGEDEKKLTRLMIAMQLSDRNKNKQLVKLPRATKMSQEELLAFVMEFGGLIKIGPAEMCKIIRRVLRACYQEVQQTPLLDQMDFFLGML